MSVGKLLKNPFLALVLVLVLASSLVACGGDNELDIVTETTNSLVANIPVQEETQEEAQEETLDVMQQGATQNEIQETPQEPDTYEAYETSEEITAESVEPYTQEPESTNSVDSVEFVDPVEPEYDVFVHDITNNNTNNHESSHGFIVIFGETEHKMFMESFLALSPGAFSAYPRGVQRNFTGLPIQSILRYFAIDYTQASFITFSSYDGFATGISIAEALQENHAFIAFEEDGQALADRGELWANAPFMLVMAQDPFPNRFARYITEILVE